MKSHPLLFALLVTPVAFLPQGQAAAILGTADNFAVLGASTVTSTGFPGTILNGDLGLDPGTSITGFLAVDGGFGIVNGEIHINNLVSEQAQLDSLAAFNAIALEVPTQNLSGQVLGSGGTVLTLFPGVYRFDSSAQLTGILILDALGDPNARFDFQIDTTLTTAPNAGITTIGGADGDNVFWQVGTSATIDTDTLFVGTIIADQSITMNDGASIDCGRAISLNAAVTLDRNVITICNFVMIPEASTFWPLLAGAPIFGVWQWMVVRRRQAGR